MRFLWIWILPPGFTADPSHQHHLLTRMDVWVEDQLQKCIVLVSYIIMFIARSFSFAEIDARPPCGILFDMFFSDK